MKHTGTYVQESDPGSSSFLLLDPGWEKTRIREKRLGSYFRALSNNILGYKYLNYLSILCCGSGSGIRNGKIQIRDSGWKNRGPGSRTNIQDPQHCLPIMSRKEL
jgi:hypothetical protein